MFGRLRGWPRGWKWRAGKRAGRRRAGGFCVTSCAPPHRTRPPQPAPVPSALALALARRCFFRRPSLVPTHTPPHPALPRPACLPPSAFHPPPSTPLLPRVSTPYHPANSSSSLISSQPYHTPLHTSDSPNNFSACSTCTSKSFAASYFYPSDGGRD